jgi:hypothetical protein
MNRKLIIVRIKEKWLNFIFDSDFKDENETKMNICPKETKMVKFHIWFRYSIWKLSNTSNENR